VSSAVNNVELGQIEPGATNSTNLAQQIYFGLNRSLIKVDTLAILSLVTLMTIWANVLVILFFPVAVYLSNRLGSLAASVFRPKSTLSRLPKDTRRSIVQMLPVPRNVFFLRGEGVDCQCISLFVVHIIMLPEGFENDLDNPDKQAVLLHELSHTSFSDYLSVHWVWVTAALVLFIMSDFYFGTMGGGTRQLIGKIPALEMAVLSAVILCALNGRSALHRREHSADLGGFLTAPELVGNLLKTQARKSTFFRVGKFEVGTKLYNWLIHPPYEKRYAVVSGKLNVPLTRIFMAGLMAGFFILHLALNVLSSLVVATYYGVTSVSLFTIPLILLGVWLLGDVVNDFFSRMTYAKTVEKLMFWAGMLIGTEFAVTVFLIANDPENFGQLTIMAANGVVVEAALTSSLLSIFVGYLFFAIYSRIVTRIVAKSYSLFFAMPLASILFFSFYEGVKMNGDFDVVAQLPLFAGICIALFIVLLLIEMFCRAVFWLVWGQWGRFRGT